MAKIRCKSEGDPKQFGSPAYIQRKFDDVDMVLPIKRTTDAHKGIAKAVAGVRSDKDNLGVVITMEAICIGPDGKPNGKVRYFSRLRVGLNGKGKQADYLSALRKLATSKAKAFIVDVQCDCLNDVYDLIVMFDRDAAVKAIK